jgi:hypothetical protein
MLHGEAGNLSAKLSFTHKLLGEEEAELDVCETGKSTPQNETARRWIWCDAESHPV